MTKRLVLLWVFLHIFTIGYAQEAVDSASDLVAQVQSILDEEEPDLDLALEIANKAIELDPELASAYNWRAEVLFMMDSTRDGVLEDYEKGTYREIPWESVAGILTAMLYVISPVDLIPDFIPVAGLLDDLTFLLLILKSVRKDVEEFEAWESQSVTS